MTLTHFNWLDYLFSSIFVLFILLALWRGLVKEVISIVTWVAGLFVGFTFAPKLAAFFTDNAAMQATLTHAGSKVGEHATANSSFTLGFCFVILLGGTLIIGAIVNYIMTKVVQGSGMSFFNRLLGGVFGFAKGFIVTLIIIFYVPMTSFAQKPVWEQSQFVQAYQPVIAWLENSSFMNSFTDMFSKRS